MLRSRFHRGSFVLVMLSVVACEGEGEPSDGGAGGSGGAPTVGGAGGGGGEATLTGWTEGPSLAQKRDHHLTFVVESDVGPVLYVAGGVVDNMDLLDSVERASISADGSIGAWTATAPLPEVAAGAGVAVVGERVVVTGGFRQTSAGNPTLSSETDVGTVMADGTIGSWTVGPTLSQTRFHHSMVADGSRLYVLGGLTGDNTDNTEAVELATLAADGTLSDWVPVTSLPTKRSHHSAVIHDGAIYVTGGLEGDPSSATYVTFDEVLRAPIMPDGMLGAWSVVGTLPRSLTTHASFAFQGALYVLGGIENDATNTASVRRATIAEDGTIGVWESLPDLPTARAHAHQVPYFDGFAYAVGGAYNHESIANAHLGRFE